MRRSTGIQALECHVLVTRSAVEANQIVNCIRSACSKYKFDVRQQTDVFQYEPYLVDKTFENHVDLITGLNTSSNSVRLPVDKKNKHEVNLGIKNNQSLLSKLKANLKDNHSSKETNNANKPRDGIPPLPTKKTAANVKIYNPSNKLESLAAVSQAILIKNETETNQKNQSKQTKATSSAVNFADKKKMSSTSTASLKQEKKLSLGKRILMSARSSIKSSSKSKLNSSSVSSVTKNDTKRKDFDYQSNIADIDFRKSRTSIIDDNLLIDANLSYPVHIRQPLSSLNMVNNETRVKRTQTPCQNNFILKSRSSASPIIKHSSRQQLNQSQLSNSSSTVALSSLGLNKRVVTSYQSTPSLIDKVERIRRSPSNSRCDLNREQNRALSVAAASRPMTPIRSEYQSHLSKNCARSEIDLYETRKIKSPCEDPKLLSTHLIWNNNSKSAESLDIKKVVNTAILQATETAMARAISPGISSINSHIAETNCYNNRRESVCSYVRNQDSASVNSYQISSKIRDQPLNTQQNISINSSGPFTKSVIVIRNDDFYIQPETSTPLIAANQFTKHEIESETKCFELSKSSRSNSRLDLLKVQIEEEQDRCASNASTRSFHERIVSNGVKVLPSLSSETAAAQRRIRIREIEENLLKDSAIGFQHQIRDVNRVSENYQFNSSFTDFSDNDHEVIDLTKQARILDSKTTDLPIEIYFSNQQQQNSELKINNRIVSLEPYNTAQQTSSKTEFTTSSCYENNESCTTHEERQQRYFNQIDNSKQINYVYYYGSNEDFGGY